MVSEAAGPAGHAPLHGRTLFTSRPEAEVAALLGELGARSPGVAIRSRPPAGRACGWLEIELASSDERRLDAAVHWLAQRLPGQPAA